MDLDQHDFLVLEQLLTDQARHGSLVGRLVMSHMVCLADAREPQVCAKG